MAQDKPTNRQNKEQQGGSWQQKNQNQNIRGNQNRPLQNDVENPNRRPGQFEDPEADN